VFRLGRFLWIVARRAIALADSEQNIGRSFWFALEHYVTNYTYFG
jgi:hypothetical protein